MGTRLTAASIKAACDIGYRADAGQPGLYLQVTQGADGSLRKSWVYRFVSPATGKRRDMGLGPVTDITLAGARDAAQNARSAVVQGLDPIVERNRSRDTARRQAANTLTFDVAAKACVEAKAPEWSNAKHAAQWTSTLTTYASKHIGTMTVRDITANDVLKVLDPIWKNKTETATRVRQRIETVLDWAAARGYREGVNPASLKGNLAQLLPKASKIAQREHHAALPYPEIHGFIVALREKRGIAAVALELLILTAARTGEVIAAEWPEIDLATKVWTVPAVRMKARREHRVPLSARAMELLKALRATATSKYVISGQSTKHDRPLSSAAMLQLMLGMDKYNDFVPHGFRSTFRDWCSEHTNVSREVAEMALAHAVEDKVEGAYRRGELFEKRRVLMEQWSEVVGKR